MLAQGVQGDILQEENFCVEGGARFFLRKWAELLWETNICSTFVG